MTAKVLKILFSFVILTIVGTTVSAQTSFKKQSYSIESEPGIGIFVHQIDGPPAPVKKKTFPLLLVHGGGGAGVASFDVRHYSVAEELAQTGFTVFLMDVRGYGQSTRIPELNDTSPSAKSTVTAENVARDIDAVVDHICLKQRVKKVAVLGWASGGHWLGYYTTKHNHKISRLILLNTLYGVNAPWKLRAAFESPDKPGVFNEQAGAFRVANAKNLVATWTNSIPAENKSEWRDEKVVDFYVSSTLTGGMKDETGQPVVRLPNGFQREAYEMSLGKKIYDATEIRVPTLVLRSELDHWSRPEDVTALERDLKNAPRKKIVTIPQATHFVFIDRPEKGRTRFFKEVLEFLGK